MKGLILVAVATMSLSALAHRGGGHHHHPAPKRVKEVGRTKLPSYYTWKHVNVHSCSQDGISGDALKIKLVNRAHALVDRMYVQFGDNSTQNINIGRGVAKFTPRRRASNWKYLKGHRRGDRCVKKVWIYGKTARRGPAGKQAVMKILMNDIKRR